MKLEGYLVIDICSDGKHNNYAFSTKEEAENQFMDCVSFYDDTLEKEDLAASADDGIWSDYSGNSVYLEPLNETIPTFF